MFDAVSSESGVEIQWFFPLVIEVLSHGSRKGWETHIAND